MFEWSDDCLKCICNFPHSRQEHEQAVETALEALRGARRGVRWDHADLFEEDEVEQPGEAVSSGCFIHEGPG